MNIQRALIVVAIFLPLMGLCDNPRYAVSAIPEELRTDVNIVLREDHMVFKILAKNKSSYAVHQVITILNANGKSEATQYVSYDKLSKIKDFNGAVYDANGRLIKKLKNSEIYDQSSFDGFSLYSDHRFKMVDLAQGTYPYTVEFEYEVENKYLFWIPSFVLVPGEKVSVENSSYSLQFASGLTPRYKVFNTDIKPTQQKTEDGLESLTWSFKNIKPIKLEENSPREDFLTRIIAAPSEFEYDKYPGTMDSWDHFGQWIISLNKGRNVLPEETKNQIKKLTQNLKTREEKVSAVYKFVQNKTRYVSIQLGIGGYQPFEASVVDQMGYGDCKALSNYAVALLESIDIKANYVLIRAGKNTSGMVTEFPYSQFNHAIAAVPNGADTIWLECTSQSNPVGYQGTFTGDRQALMITDNGARIVNTVRYTAEQNVQSRTADVNVDLTGNATATVRTTYAGLQYENDHLNFIQSNQFDDQRKWIQENTNIPNFDINSFSMTEHKNKIPSVVVKLDLTLRRYSTVSGKRIFLTPNLMNKSTVTPEKTDGRKSNLVRNMAYTDLDTIRYHLPEGIYPEFLPAPVKLKNRFGEYEVNYAVDQGILIYTRKQKMYKGTFPPEAYQEYLDFYKAINRSDNTKIVFMSKT